MSTFSRVRNAKSKYISGDFNLVFLKTFVVNMSLSILISRYLEEIRSILKLDKPDALKIFNNSRPSQPVAPLIVTDKFEVILLICTQSIRFSISALILGKRGRHIAIIEPQENLSFFSGFALLAA